MGVYSYCPKKNQLVTNYVHLYYRLGPNALGLLSETHNVSKQLIMYPCHKTLWMAMIYLNLIHSFHVEFGACESEPICSLP